MMFLCCMCILMQYFGCCILCRTAINFNYLCASLSVGVWKFANNYKNKIFYVGRQEDYFFDGWGK